MCKDTRRATTVGAMHGGNSLMRERYSWIGSLDRSVIPGGDCSEVDPGDDVWRQIEMPGGPREVIGHGHRAKSDRDVDDRPARALGLLCIRQGCIRCAKVHCMAE